MKYVPHSARQMNLGQCHCLYSHVQCITLPHRTCGGAPARHRVASLRLDSAESQGESPYLAQNAGGTCRDLILPERFSLKLRPHQTQVKMRSKGAYAIDPFRMRKWRNCYSYLGGCSLCSSPVRSVPNEDVRRSVLTVRPLP